MILKNVNRDMSGQYTCTVTRGSESKSSTMKVDVYYTAKIQSILLTTDGKKMIKNRYQIELVLSKNIQSTSNTFFSLQLELLT